MPERGDGPLHLLGVVVSLLTVSALPSERAGAHPCCPRSCDRRRRLRAELGRGRARPPPGTGLSIPVVFMRCVRVTATDRGVDDVLGTVLVTRPLEIPALHQPVVRHRQPDRPRPGYGPAWSVRRAGRAGVAGEAGERRGGPACGPVPGGGPSRCYSK